ncbi:MAG: exodeoxyribonuclease VII small subunit [Chloroflexi bacterium]|nr:exodeoxyribonuclease VII small subunit [Chloroflexota bacterium]
MSFEEAFAELEAIVQQLEEGNTPLAEALALYERGMSLAARCQALLDEAEVRIKQLIPNDDGGFDEVDFTGSLDSRD